MGFLAEQYAAGAAAGDEAWVSAGRARAPAAGGVIEAARGHAEARSNDDYDEGARRFKADAAPVTYGWLEPRA